MPHNLTETSTFTANVSVPDAGDARSAASVETGFQAVTNRTKYLKDHIDTLESQTLDARIDVLEGRVISGLMLGPGIVSSSNGTQITVHHQHVLIIGTQQWFEPSDATVAPVVHASSSWHYLYAYNNAGAIAYESSLTAPGSDLVFEGGDASRRYICSYYVNSSNLIRPFRKTGNKYMYRGTATTDPLSITGLTVGTTLQNIAAYISPFSKHVCLTLFVNNNTVDKASVLRVFHSADTDTTNAPQVNGNNIASVNNYLSTELETTGVPEVRVTVAGDTSGGSIVTGGFAINGYYE